MMDNSSLPNASATAAFNNNKRPSSASSAHSNHSSSSSCASKSSSTTTLAGIALKLSDLPLRPSTLSALLRRGFATSADVDESRRGEGGLSNFAAEVGCGLSVAAGYAREVSDAVRSALGEQCTEEDQQHQQQDSGRGVRSGSALPDHPSQRRASRSYVDPNPPSAGVGQGVTAASLLLSSTPESRNRHVITFCRSIDALLGGGVARSELTELAGVPGVGKTQLAMQLCVDARLPRRFGGVEGESVFIDAEGSFSPERCRDMAEALVGHVRDSAERRQRAAVVSKTAAAVSGRTAPPPPPSVPDWFTPDSILDGVHVFRVHDEACQTATLRSLPGFLQEREAHGTPVKVVVIDSIAFHYRSAAPNTDYKARTRSLATIAAFLSDLAANFDLAVVAINQMTTKVGGCGGAEVIAGEGDTRLVPALGESWAHATTTRLLLTHSADDGGGGARCCRLVKCPHKAAGTALYAVTEVGIRDVPPPRRPLSEAKGVHNQMPRNRVQISDATSMNAMKRPRTHY